MSTRRGPLLEVCSIIAAGTTVLLSTLSPGERLSGSPSPATTQLANTRAAV
uniref:Uncharacterized protein n=1 Tax=Arundo donax TaxID=35708 RepID=A0A0A9AXS7_ARUDO